MPLLSGNSYLPGNVAKPKIPALPATYQQVLPQHHIKF